MRLQSTSNYIKHVKQLEEETHERGEIIRKERQKNKRKKEIDKKNPKYYDNLWVQFNLKIHRAART